MIQRTVHVRGSRASVVASLRTIPTVATQGGHPADAMMENCALALRRRIHQAFLVKAGGGTDEAGEKWEPLSPKTTAYRKSNRTRTESSRESRPSQALNQKQQDRWWEVYRGALASYKGNRGHAAAA